MNIFDLNHIEAVEGTEVLGGSPKKKNDNFDININIKKDFDVNIKEYVDVFKTYNIFSVVKGNSALAEGDAEAYGKNSSAQSLTFTRTIENVGSTASSTSVSNS